MISEQTLLNAGPLLVRASEDAAAAGYIFNVLMIARAPLVLFQAVATSLLPHLTRLRSSATATDADAFRLSIRLTLGAIAVFAGLVALVVLIAGPALMQVAFGDKFSYDRVGLLLVTVGMGFYLSSGALNQAALARGQARFAAACWVTAAVGLPGLEPAARPQRVSPGRGGFVGCRRAPLWAPVRAVPERPHPRRGCPGAGLARGDRGSARGGGRATEPAGCSLRVRRRTGLAAYVAPA